MVVIGFDETFPLWALSATEVGGLGYGAKRIGQVRTISVVSRFRVVSLSSRSDCSVAAAVAAWLTALGIEF